MSGDLLLRLLGLKAQLVQPFPVDHAFVDRARSVLSALRVEAAGETENAEIRRFATMLDGLSGGRAAVRDRIVIPARESREVRVRRWDPEPLHCEVCDDTGEVAPRGSVQACPVCGGRRHLRHRYPDLWGPLPGGGPTPRWGMRA